MVQAARCLDQSVIGHGLDLQALREAGDALSVHRIDLRAATAVPLRQPAIGGQGHRMGRPILHFHQRLRVFAMVGQAGHRMHLRMQAATQRDVQFLETATDRQHRQVQRQRFVQQRKGIGIPGRIMRIAWPAAATLVVLRFDIADRAGQQQAIEPKQPVAGRQRWLQARQHHRGHLGRLGQRAHVLLAGHRETVVAEHGAVGGQAHPGQAAHGDTPWRADTLPVAWQRRQVAAVTPQLPRIGETTGVNADRPAPLRLPALRPRGLQ